MKNKQIVIISITAAVLAAVIGVLFPIPTHDTVMRYAVMAEKFAIGEWKEAFHPRFGVLFPFLAGLIKTIFRCDGISACTATSMFAWVFTGIPFFCLARSVFGSRVAWLSVVLYFICPLPLLWGLQGLRETWRLFGVVLMTAGLFENKESQKRAFFFSIIGLSILLLLRADTIVFAVMFFVAYAILDRFRARTWWLLSLGLLLIQIPCYNVWKWTGWWLPAAQYIEVYRKIIGL